MAARIKRIPILTEHEQDQLQERFHQLDYAIKADLGQESVADARRRMRDYMKARGVNTFDIEEG